MRPLAALLVLTLAPALAACPREAAMQPARDPEPVAEPAPIELDWPDAGVAR